MSPGGQLTGRDIPWSGQMYPMGQVTQPVCPSRGWKVPGLQIVKLRALTGQ